jgi:GNAT superfamily N-acetyltransferase
MSVEYLDLATAAQLLGREEYNQQIAWMCQKTYQIWWDTYFKHNQDKYPTWQILYDLNMALTDQPADTPREKLVNGHLKGFVAVADKTKIIGYINLIYNEVTPEELQTLTIPIPSGQDTIWASDLLIWPEFRRQGFANKLFDFAVGWLQQQLDNPEVIKNNSLKYLYLCCENHLVGLYAKKGCQLISSVPDEFGWQYMRYPLISKQT